MFGTLKMVVACCRLAHLLQQVDKVRLYILKPDIMSVRLVKVYPRIRSALVFGIGDQSEHNKWIGVFLLAL